MKIRINGNSIRIRLSKPEVELFHRKGQLEEHLNFGLTPLPRPTVVFTYRIERLSSADNMFTDLSNNVMSVYIPVQQAYEWATTPEMVSMEHNANIDDEWNIHILIEKDYKS